MTTQLRIAHGGDNRLLGIECLRDPALRAAAIALDNRCSDGTTGAPKWYRSSAHNKPHARRHDLGRARTLLLLAWLYQFSYTSPFIVGMLWAIESAARVSAKLSTLARLGLIQRIDAPTLRGGVLIRLTQAGRAELQAHVPFRLAAEGRVTHTYVRHGIAVQYACARAVVARKADGVLSETRSRQRDQRNHKRPDAVLFGEITTAVEAEMSPKSDVDRARAMRMLVSGLRNDEYEQVVIISHSSAIARDYQTLIDSGVLPIYEKKGIKWRRAGTEDISDVASEMCVLVATELRTLLFWS